MTMGDSADEILLQIKEKAVKPSYSIYWHFLHAFSCRTNSLPMKQSIRKKMQRSVQEKWLSLMCRICFVNVKTAFQYQSPPFAEHIVWVHFSAMVIHSQDTHGTLYVNTTCRRLSFRFVNTAPEMSSQWLAYVKNVMETNYSFSINSLDAVVYPHISLYTV